MTEQNRPRGRPSGADSPTTRAELLEGAVRLIAERGFAGASIRAIAKACGVSHGTLQNHFPTKKALWEAIVDEVLLPAGMGPGPTPDSRLEEVIEATLRLRIERATSGLGIWGAVMTDRSEGAEERLAYLAQRTKPTTDAGVMIIEALAGTALLKVRDPRSIVAMMIVLSSLSGLDTALRQLLGLDLADEDTKEDLIADLSQILLQGLLPRSAPSSPSPESPDEG